MNEDFVSFSLAMKLKEKGFNQPCLAHYTNGKFEYNIAYFDEVTLPDLYENWGHGAGCFVDAPTISQVFKWLREEKVLFVEVSVDNYNGFDFYFTIYEKGEESWVVCRFSEEWYDTYEGAAFAGIEYVLDNLI
jgi:hypothetical protein